MAAGPPGRPDEPADHPPAHVPVLLERCVALLAPALAAPGSVVVDCTLGMGGHAVALLRAVPSVRLVGLDRDPEALRRSGERLAPFGDRVTLVHAVYDALPQVLGDLGIAVQPHEPHAGCGFEQGLRVTAHAERAVDDDRVGSLQGRGEQLDAALEQDGDVRRVVPPWRRRPRHPLSPGARAPPARRW